MESAINKVSRKWLLQCEILVCTIDMFMKWKITFLDELWVMHDTYTEKKVKYASQKLLQNIAMKINMPIRNCYCQKQPQLAEKKKRKSEHGCLKWSISSNTPRKVNENENGQWQNNLKHRHMTVFCDQHKSSSTLCGAPTSHLPQLILIWTNMYTLSWGK